MDSLTAGALVFLTIIANAIGKIVIMLLGVIIAFLAIPQSRAAAMFSIAIISAFAGGVLIEIYSVQQNWSLAAAMGASFGAGFLVYPFLSFFRKFNELASKDEELVGLLFQAFKEIIKRFIPKKGK